MIPDLFTVDMYTSVNNSVIQAPKIEGENVCRLPTKYDDALPCYV